ncbi:glycosyltransferase family 15 protein [Infundibulicybe gibba]|nr:glycosyltransferase family 15 protein [Infundibulicybe gibba]
MNTPTRYILLALGIIISLHYILSFTQEEYGRATSLSNITSKLKGGGSDSSKSHVPDDYLSISHSANVTGRRANATFVILARNNDLDSTVRSIREIEERFNRKYNYPYTLLNEEPFNDDFKKRISVLTAASVEFGVIPREHWYQPDTIDEEKATAGRNKMVKDNIIYGGTYRNMCRFNSGFFFKHPLMEKYRWYWRIEPDVHFHCDVNFDPFVFMEDKNKVYAFTIGIYEYEATIPTLWGHVKDFIKKYPEFVAPNNAMGYLSDNDGETYNLCHFWSNFEIADMDFWRAPAYSTFFEYLDSKGGFYYERWGDAPVHSIAAALFAQKDQIQFFDEIGYEHNPYTHCPQSEEKWRQGRCSCDQKRSFDYDGYSCMRQWDRIN